MTPRQLLWVDNAPVETTDSDHKHLTESDLPDLSVHACKWRDIGMYLGFQQTELDDIQARPFLLQDAPKSWLRAMLSEWLQWAPKDSRGSSSFATLLSKLLNVLSTNVRLE